MDSVTQVEWREVVEYPGYFVSSIGDVRGRSGRILKQGHHSAGYLSVGPVRDGKNVTTLVHRLVAAAFIGPIPAGHEVNHIDGNKKNNRAENLEYVTRRGNMSHARRIGLWDNRGEKNGQAKVSDAAIVRGCELAMTTTIADAAKEVGVPTYSLAAALSGSHWKHLNCRRKDKRKSFRWSDEILEFCRKMRRGGMTYKTISEHTGVPEETVRRHTMVQN